MRVLVYPEVVEGSIHWILQGIEWDIVASGPTLKAAIDNFVEISEAELKLGKPSPPPKRFEAAYHGALTLIANGPFNHRLVDFVPR